MHRRMSLQAIQLIMLVVLAGIPYVLWVGQSSALLILDRSVTISDATAGAVASQNFQLTLSSTDPIGSIVFQYCVNSPLFDVSCIPPTGALATGAVLSQQTGNTGFTIDTIDSTATTLIISRPVAAASTVPSSYVFTNMVNPPIANQTVYVRISTYASTQGTGSYIDNGAVAYSTASNFLVGAYVPPFLNMCVGVTVAGDCSSATGDSIDLGNMSTKKASVASSQFAVTTNDSTGCNVYVLGTTMTSGNNVIPGLAQPTSSQVGTSQFGINLRQNSNPIVGLDPTGNGTTAPTGSYNSPNLFTFISGDQIASSPISTDYHRMTVSYLVNIGPNQPAGVYSTTLTYMASAQF